MDDLASGFGSMNLRLSGSQERTQKPLCRRQYRKVYVILLIWEEDETGYGPQMFELQHVYSQLYNFKVTPIFLRLSQPENHLAQDLSNFRRSKVKSDTLLIVHYSGHGGWANGTDYGFSATAGPEQHALAPCPRVRWDPIIRTALEDMPCDVLVTIDSCLSGVLAAIPDSRSPPYRYTKEAITACDYARATRSTNPAGYPAVYTFTAALTKELRRRAYRGEPFTVASLHRGIVENLIERIQSGAETDLQHAPSPVHYFLDDSLQHTSIVLRPVRRRTSIAHYSAPIYQPPRRYSATEIRNAQDLTDILLLAQQEFALRKLIDKAGQDLHVDNGDD